MVKMPIRTHCRKKTLFKGDVYLVGLSGNVKVVNGIIHVTEVSYADSDPSCCPSKRRTVKLKSNNQGKLVKVK